MIGNDQLTWAVKLLQPDYFVSHDTDSVHQTDKHISAVMYNALTTAYSLQAITW